MNTENKIIVSPIKTTKNFEHFVAYQVTKKGMHLIAPGSGKEEAKKAGMNYNSFLSGLPPYTFKIPMSISYASDRILEALKFTLGYSGKKGKFEVYILDGNNVMPKNIEVK